MKLWEPQTCCCCASPRTASLIIGWLGIVGSVLELLGMLQKLASGQEDTHNTYVFSGILIGGAIHFIWLGCCIALVYGVNKNRPRLMLPYMIMQAIMIVVLILAAITGIIICLYFEQWILAAVLLVILPPFIFFMTYVLLVIRVHYKELTQPEKPGNEGIEIEGIPYKA